jgi:TPR repeat protein
MANDELAVIMKVAECGDPEAQYKLGFSYDKGKGVDRDAEKSVYWFKKAAEQGDETAKDNLRQLRDAGFPC